LIPLLPTFPSTPLPETALFAPVLAMGSLWKWTTSCALVAALGFLALRSLDKTPETARATNETATAARAKELQSPAAHLALTPTQVSAEREAVATRPPAQAIEAKSVEVAAARLIGFVRDVQHRPVSDLAVACEPLDVSNPAVVSGPGASSPALASARSGFEGRFEMPWAGEACRLVARGRGFATLVAPSLSAQLPPEPPVVFVGPACEYAGLVVDSTGAPVPRARLVLRLEEELGRALTPGTFAAVLPLASVTADEQGAFAFPALGGAEGSTLTASHEGFEAVTILVPSTTERELVLTLQREQRSTALAGRVFRHDGKPADGAYVAAGDAAARCDANGAFALAGEAAQHATRLQAVLPGAQPGELDLTGLASEARQALEIVLGPPALALAGRVRDSEGRPVEGAFVWTPDGERFGNVPTEVGDITFMLTFDLEGVIAGAGANNQAGGRRARTDAQGHFELTGLVARRYALYAQHPRTFELVGPLTVSAGADSAELAFAGEERQRVAGRVVTYSGEPVAGADVAVLRTRAGERGASGPYPGSDVPSLTTDSEGRFAFDELCTAGTELRVTAKDALTGATFALIEHTDLGRLELALAATCHLRLRLDDPDFADGLELHDERDRALEITFQLGGIHCMSQSVEILRGVSDVLITDETARTLVLFKDSQEVERIPLRLEPGRINELQR
jgi:hypothetical protein